MKTTKPLKFYKYQGAGNDFILFDNRQLDFDHIKRADFLYKLCHRRFGVGGDGVMFLEEKKGYAFEMLYYNSDGKPSSMCGNGGRCIVAFANHLGIAKDKEEIEFLAIDGPHKAKINAEGDWVSLKMIDVDKIIKDGESFVLFTGSPHFVTFVPEAKDVDVVKDGRAIRNREDFAKEGINVNFVQEMEDYYFVRTYERGVEDETYACGTGVTAVALTLAQKKGHMRDIKYNFKVVGGKLSVKFNYNGSEFTNIFLEGPAKKVFEGEIDANSFLELPN